MPEHPLRVIVVQNNAGADPGKNLARIGKLLPDEIKGALVALPEVFAGRGNDEHYRRMAEPIRGALSLKLGALAKQKQVFLLAGSIIECRDASFFNTSILFNPRGEIAAIYRKIHLFEALLEDGRTIREADLYENGIEPVMADVSGWSCGFAICYDLRFPELFRRYSASGAHLLLIPSNFTQRTGRDHWETLVRARAIENQCFVVAPDQCGANPATGVASYGHSMIVGPWGEVLAKAGEEETIISAVLDPEILIATRRRVPALQHRRL